MQEPVLEERAVHLDAVGQDEAADKAPGGDAPVQEGVALAPVIPPPGEGQLAIFQGDLQGFWREARHSEGDPEGAAPQVLDIVGRITFRGGLGGALDLAARVLEAEEEGAVEEQVPVHGSP